MHTVRPYVRGRDYIRRKRQSWRPSGERVVRKKLEIYIHYVCRSRRYYSRPADQAEIVIQLEIGNAIRERYAIVV